ncbi:PTS cellobiose transporter subunit IIC [Yersinia enterocolitica]|uniref:Permease IIC component n=1 Tax=Yersinia enterocolitica serotype O:8 / biotype 1B (strain NCTC 13174 / 8081) TaxID=393305 RepID=A1JSY0_YERE8|nr:PTS cellobiose transporter subunit IIC [Yersinia enterocolitica]AJJ24573.1 PTS system, lactose/cellobiose IIC component family protein [Yersinia enterocolitica]CAL14121.1 Putative phosphotransferase protein [Yersinia enterocolitica subsp. enterocolitica 8081]HDL8279737.1 PTS cellobiose transporter subunit IIC [Yersinia enterocolitica]HDM8288775.1 PTS cellobiose transporter subunit IIC [Yersinia enterocolitica]HDM8293048.1 PTS cellobiose transporter subunit IIC [Yersinia enterocolitica]
MGSLYSKLIDVIEQKITPMAGAIGQQKYVTSIRDGFIAALPFMIVGSFMLVFIFPPFSPDTTWRFASAWLQFSLEHRASLMLPFNFSMGIMTLFISVGIAASLARHHNLDPLTSGMLSLMAFLLVAAPLKDGQISTAYFSGQGIFTAILVAIYSTELYAILKRHNITIRLPPEVPTGVARSFEILIPVLAVILTLHPLNLFIEAQLGMIIPEAIMSLVKPLVAASDTLPAILISVLVCQVLWFAGIHGALIVTGIMNPFWMANLSVNQAAMAASQAIPHIYVQGFWDHYLLIGGVGSTLPLALLLMRSKAVHLRTIGRMGIVPGMFNINEPILFGAPIIMNPLFFIPFVLVPMVNATLAYFALDFDLVSRVVQMTPWTTPAPIGASWAANWTFSPVILCLICMATSAVMYFPFLKAYEKQLLEQETDKATAHNATAQTDAA